MKNTERVKSDNTNSAYDGVVKWSPVKSIWFSSHLSIAIVVAPFVLSLSSFLVFVSLAAVTLCFGHSLGMHRLLIHRSYECPKWMEYLFVYLGVWLGMAGPIGMLKQHDLRDSAQRQTKCHDFLLHGSNVFKDAWWQLNCDLELNNHHAYPGSAMLDLYSNEPDPGWCVLNALRNLGIVQNIKLPKQLPQRSELVTEARDLDQRIERVPEDCEIANSIRRSC